jgi:pyridoxal phosphate enzyme (YggS family)
MNNTNYEELQHRLEKIKERIKQSAINSGRNLNDVKLIVVTKGKSAAVIKNLVELGVSRIGESYLNEALFKQEILKDYEIDWHMIGNIQKSKAKQIIYNFNTIHSVDRLSLTKELHDKALQISKKVAIYLELNVSGESTKHGWSIRNDNDYTVFAQDFEKILDMPALFVKGLMTMAPYSINPEDSRPCFRKLKEIRDMLFERFPLENDLGLSMGMSGDFEVAIQEGATILRVGSAIVGER